MAEDTKTIYCNATVRTRDADGNKVKVAPGQPVTLPVADADRLIAAHGGGLYEEPKQAVDPGKPRELESMTVAELKDYAAKHDIDLGDATKKADIIAAIELAQ